VASGRDDAGTGTVVEQVVAPVVAPEGQTTGNLAGNVDAGARPAAVTHTRESLTKLKDKKLVTLAESLGVPKGRKSAMVAGILKKQEQPNAQQPAEVAGRNDAVSQAPPAPEPIPQGAPAVEQGAGAVEGAQPAVDAGRGGEVKRPESDQDVSFREWRENFDRVQEDVRIATARDLLRASAYADELARAEVRKAKEENRPVNQKFHDAMRQESQDLAYMSRQREKELGLDGKPSVPAEGTAVPKSDTPPAPAPSEAAKAGEQSPTVKNAPEGGAVGDIKPGLTFRQYVEARGHKFGEVSGPGHDRALAERITREFGEYRKQPKAESKTAKTSEPIGDRINRLLSENNSDDAYNLIATLKKDDVEQVWRTLAGRGFYNKSRQQMLSEIKGSIVNLTSDAQAKARVSQEEGLKRSELKSSLEYAIANKNGNAGAPMKSNITDEQFRQPHAPENKEAVQAAWRKNLTEQLTALDTNNPDNANIITRVNAFLGASKPADPAPVAKTDPLQNVEASREVQTKGKAEAPKADEVPNDTPAMKQWHAFKKQYPDAVILFKIGDFYETFGPDAQVLSDKLGVTLTTRAGKTGEVKMAGIPYHAVDARMKELISKGVKVAIAEPAAKDPFDGEQLRLVNRESGSGDQTPPRPKVRVVEGEAKADESKIEDFGEKIGGARKDRWRHRGLDVADTEGMTSTELQTYGKKDQVMPKVDYADYIDAGMPKDVAYLVKQVRDRINSEPQFNKEQQADPVKRGEAVKRYIELVGKVRDGLSKVRTTDDIRALHKELFPTEGHYLTKEASQDLRLVGGKSFNSAMQPGSWDLTKAGREAEKRGFPGKQEAWERQFRIEEYPAGSSYSDKDGKLAKRDTPEFAVSAKSRDRYLSKRGFATREEAVEWAKSQVAERAKEPQRPFNPDEKRVGEDARGGKDASPDELLSEYGFRGGEFGLWTNAADRQQSINQTFDALHDLAAKLGVPPKALSLNGELGIAFGARGGGKAAAHYEPGKVVINLTKTRGAGTLAHEWAHGMDDYFGRMATTGQPGKYVSHGFSDKSPVRPEVVEAWGKVMKAISERVADTETTVADAGKNVEKAQKYVSSWLKPIEARIKGTAIEEQASELIAMLKGEKPPALPNGLRPPAADLVEPLGRLLKSAKLEGIDAQTRKNIEANVHYLERTKANQTKAIAGELRRMEPTDFLKASEAMGKGKSDNYWARRHELFARAFESYLAQKLEDAGETSPYLVQGVPTKKGSMKGGAAGGDRPESPDAWGNLYPRGRDAEAINAAFDNLFSTIKTRESTKPNPAGGSPIETVEMYSGIPLPKVLRELKPDIPGAINFVTGEISAPLHKNAPGRHVRRQLDTKETKKASLLGKLQNDSHDAITALSRSDRNWLSEHDPLGYSNMQRMREDTVAGRVAAPNPKLAAIETVTQKMMDLTGDEAVRVGLPRADGTPFVKAKSGRFLRQFTPEAVEAIHNGGGPMLDAIEAAIVRDNPGVTLDMAKEMLNAIRDPDPIRHVGALEKVRTIKNLPSYVEVNGEWYPILETDPSRAIMGAASTLADRIYFYEQFGDDAAVAKLRADYVHAGGSGRDFDNTIAVANGRKLGGQYDPRQTGVRIVRATNSLISAAQTSLSAIPNVPQTLVQVPRYTGWGNYAKAVGNALMHPKATVRDVAALGAMNRSVMDWTVQDGRRLEDYTRIITGSMNRLSGAHWVAQFNNMVAGKAFEHRADSWKRNGLPNADLGLARDLRLTPKEITEIRAGKMSPETYGKIVQNGVKITQYITEDPHRKSRFQHSPLFNAIFSYQNYGIGTAKSTGRMVAEIQSAFKSKPGSGQRLAAGRHLASMLVGTIGAGLLTTIMRRGIQRQELVKDDETTASMIGKALWETQLLGPAQRMFETNDRQTWDQWVTNLSPKVRMLVNAAAALSGDGDYEATPRNEVAGKFASRNIPAYRAASKWMGEAPQRRTAAERKANELLYSKVEFHSTPEKTLHNRFKKDFVLRLRKPENVAQVDQELRAAEDAGKLTREEVREIRNWVEGGDLLHTFKRLPTIAAVEVYGIATPAEKEQIRAALRSKILDDDKIKDKWPMIDALGL
jgi:hypothetical protein